MNKPSERLAQLRIRPLKDSITYLAEDATLKEADHRTKGANTEADHGSADIFQVIDARRRLVGVLEELDVTNHEPSLSEPGRINLYRLVEVYGYLVANHPEETDAYLEQFRTVIQRTLTGMKDLITEIRQSALRQSSNEDLGTGEITLQ